jgi:hypothetical protein
MDAEVLRLMAHIDQTRSQMREALTEIGADNLPRLVKTCARGALTEFDEREQLLVGMLAIVAAFDLLERKDD